MNVGLLQSCSSEAGFLKVYASELRPDEICFLEICPVKVSFKQGSVLQTCRSQVRIIKFRKTQICSIKRSLRQVGAIKVASFQVSVFQKRCLHLRFRKISR